MIIESIADSKLLRGKIDKPELSNIKYQRFGFYVLPVYEGTLHTMLFKNINGRIQLIKYLKGGMIDINIRNFFEGWLNEVIPLLVEEFTVSFVILKNVIVIETFEIIKTNDINYDSLFLLLLLKEYVPVISRYENEIILERPSMNVMIIEGISLSPPKEISLMVDFLKQKLNSFSYSTHAKRIKLIPFKETSHEGITGIDLTNNYLIIKI